MSGQFDGPWGQRETYAQGAPPPYGPGQPEWVRPPRRSFFGRIFGGFFRWIGRMFLNAFAVVGTLVALLIVLVLGAAILGSIFGPGIPKQTVLEIDARGGFGDAPAPASFVGSRPPSFIEILLALDKAKDDERVKGVILRVGQGGIAGAHVQELKTALDALRANGKFVIAHATSFGGPGVGQYALATLADEIWLQRTSEMGATGLMSSTVFLRGLFDRLEATPDIGKRWAYKNAANVYTETDYTPEHREATTVLLESIYATLNEIMAAGRKMDAGAMQAAIFGGPYLTDEAIAAKLVDKTGFWDDAKKAAEEKAGADGELVAIADYAAEAGTNFDSGPGVVAVIQGEGAIMDGESGESFTEGRFMGGDTIAQAIRDATEDKDVKAILFRVNTPGGSALASDTILDALKKAQAEGKPVIVSMGPVAASGGYWVSMYADRIFASESTITGSIGVLSGKLVVNRTFELAGLNPRLIKVGPNADMYSEFQQWTPEQRAKFEKTLDQIYDAFTGRVAEGRKLPIEKVREVAQGRVWTGIDAKARGLVDELGGFQAALAETVKRAGLEEGKAKIRFYPEEDSAWANLWKTLRNVESSARIVGALGEVMNSDAVRGLAKALDTGSDAHETRMPDTEIK
jgi:protease IV